MNSNTDDRLRALETALQSCIDYLRRMPLNPQTVQQMREAQAVLDNATPAGRLGLIGEVITPVGVVFAGAIVADGKATVYTKAVPGRGEDLLRSLRQGITFDLHPIGQYRQLPTLDERPTFQNDEYD